MSDRRLARLMRWRRRGRLQFANLVEHFLADRIAVLIENIEDGEVYCLRRRGDQRRIMVVFLANNDRSPHWNPLPFGLLELGADANVRLEYHAMRILSHDKYDVLIHAHADAAMSKHYQR